MDFKNISTYPTYKVVFPKSCLRIKIFAEYSWFLQNQNLKKIMLGLVRNKGESS